MTNAFELMVPQLERLPDEQLTGPLGREVMKPSYDNVQFPEDVNDKIIGAMGRFEREQNTGSRAVRRTTVRVAETTRNLFDSQARRAQSAIDSLLGLNMDDLAGLPDDDEKLLRYAGMLYKTDQILRQVPGGGLREGLATLSAEELQELAGVELGEDESGRGINFQDPVKGEQDVRRGVERMREKKNTFSVVWIPPNYEHHIQAQLFKSEDLYIPGTRLIKPNLLTREFDVRVLGPGQFSVVPMAERQYTEDLPAELHKAVNGFQTLAFLQRLVNGDGGAQQYLRSAQGFLKAEGTDVGSIAKAILPGSAKAQQYFQLEMNAPDDKVIGRLAEAALTPMEQAGVVIGTRAPLVVDVVRKNGEGKNQSQVAVAEIGVARLIDAFYGDYGAVRKNEAGQDLYVPVDDLDAAPKPFGEYTTEEQALLWPVFDDEEDPLRVGPTIHVQQLYTKDPIQAEEVGASPFLSAVQRELHRNGLPTELGEEIEDIRIRGELMDNGRVMSLSNSKVQDAMNEEGGSDEEKKKAGLKHMLVHVLFSNHAGEIAAGLGLTQQWQRDGIADVTLIGSSMPESRISAFMREMHSLKYRNMPPLAIPFVRQYNKSLEVWKATVMDWTLKAVDGKRGFKAIWRNQLSPENAPEIMPVTYRDTDIPIAKVFKGLLTWEEKLEKGLLTKEQRKSLEGDAKDKFNDRKLSDVEVKAELVEEMVNKMGLSEDELLRIEDEKPTEADLVMMKEGMKLVKLVLYSRDEWAINQGFEDLATAIVDSAAKARHATSEDERKKWEGATEALSKTAFQLYVTNYDYMAPSGHRRSIQEALPLLQRILEDETMSSWLKDFNWGSTLESAGDYELEGIPVEHRSQAVKAVQGLLRAVRLRRSETTGAWMVDKPGKYDQKYPEGQAEYGKALMQVQTELNNAIQPFLMNVVGGIPDQFQGLSADQVTEAMGKQLVNLMFLNRRKQGETQKFVEGIVEKVLAVTETPGSFTTEEKWLQIANIVRQVAALSQAVVSTNKEFQKVMKRTIDGKDLEVAGPAQGLNVLEFKGDDKLLTKSLRKAPFGTSYSDGTTGRNPVVTLGTRPVYAGQVKVAKDPKTGDWDVERIEREVHHLSYFAHRGAESLTVAIIAMFVEDKLQAPSEILRKAIAEGTGISEEYYEKLRGWVRERMAENLQEGSNGVVGE